MRDQNPRYISIVEDTGSTPRGSAIRFYVRIGDASGLATMETPPAVTVAGGTGSLTGVASSDAAYPGMWCVDVRLDSLPVLNSFRVVAGDVSQTLQVAGHWPQTSKLFAARK